MSKFIRMSLFLFLLLSFSCMNEPDYYTVSDFEKISKIDSHFHYLTLDGRYMEMASSINFRLLSPNWDWNNTIDEQLRISDSIVHRYPGKYAFFGTFSVDSFSSVNFSKIAIERIKKCLAEGATGIKIWKNIGMTLLDKNGKYVMIDDPAFDPVFDYLEKNNIPVIGHLGEPKDCWLPMEKMTDPSDKIYYTNNPEYYMYLRPEVPSYDAQIAARDNLLKKHPRLDFIGAHLGSLEWSVDELAKRFELFPNLKVDIAARMDHLQYQSKLNYEKVRSFLIKYQDRILYATDNEVYDKPGIDNNSELASILAGWKAQWIYLSTDSTIGVQGLKLPRNVIDKIYYTNAEKYFRLSK